MRVRSRGTRSAATQDLETSCDRSTRTGGAGATSRGSMRAVRRARCGDMSRRRARISHGRRRQRMVGPAVSRCPQGGASCLTGAVTAIDFPRTRMASLHELAARVLEKRALAVEGETLARDLFVGFFDVCMRWGLDRVLNDLEQAFCLSTPPTCSGSPIMPSFEAGSSAARQEVRFRQRGAAKREAATAGRLPRRRTIAGAGRRAGSDDRAGRDVRKEAFASITAVVEVELGVPQVRTTVKGRELCEELSRRVRSDCGPARRAWHAHDEQLKVPPSGAGLQQILTEVGPRWSSGPRGGDRSGTGAQRTNLMPKAVDQLVTLRALARGRDPSRQRAAGQQGAAGVAHSCLTARRMANLAWRPVGNRYASTRRARRCRRGRARSPEVRPRLGGLHRRATDRGRVRRRQARPGARAAQVAGEARLISGRRRHRRWAHRRRPWRSIRPPAPSPCCPSRRPRSRPWSPGCCCRRSG